MSLAKLRVEIDSDGAGGALLTVDDGGGGIPLRLQLNPTSSISDVAEFRRAFVNHVVAFEQRSPSPEAVNFLKCGCGHEFESLAGLGKHIGACSDSKKIIADELENAYIYKRIVSSIKEWMATKREFTLQDIVVVATRHVEVSPATLRKHLEWLVKQGDVEITHQGRPSRYAYVES